MEKAVFAAELEELHKILQWIRVRLEKKGLEGRTVRRLELALEEAVVNIIRHGYRGKLGKIEIGVKWSQERVEIVIRDWASPFDLLTHSPKINNQASLEEQETGGLGISLIKQIVDEVVYQRENNTNLLTLVKRLPLN